MIIAFVRRNNSDCIFHQVFPAAAGTNPGSLGCMLVCQNNLNVLLIAKHEYLLVKIVYHDVVIFIFWQKSLPSQTLVVFFAFDETKSTSLNHAFLVTFRVSRRRHEMYCGHARLSVCVCLSAAACLHYTARQ